MNGDDFIKNLLQFFKITKNEKGFIYQDSVNIIEVEKVKLLYEEILDMPRRDLTLSRNIADGDEITEVAIFKEHTFQYSFKQDKPVRIEDHDNIIKYEISKMSDHYLIWIYSKIFVKYPFSEKRGYINRVSSHITMRALGPLRRKGQYEDEEELSLLNIMRRSVRYLTLKVTKGAKSHIGSSDAINAFNYTYMYNFNEPIKLYDFEEIIGLPKPRFKVRNLELDAPKRKYNSNLIDYYNLATSSEDPFVSFISYYHIIEYFFDDVFREQQISTLRTNITSPRFSYKDDEKLYAIIEKIIKDNKLVRENGSGNEHQSLNYVLNKFIHDLQDFKQRLDEEEIDFYKNVAVSFSGGDMINWDKNNEKILKSISNRIYKTRNALIHSKSSKKSETYHPYMHKNELEKEISLIKAIADSVIENSSELL